MTKPIDDIIDEVIRAEGGYVNDPNDSGGATCFGITEKVARANGYRGDMKDLPISFARKVYFSRYVIEPCFDKVLLLSYEISAELVDTGVNCGVSTASKFLQVSLNAFNKQGTIYPDLIVDGNIGNKTITALANYLKFRPDGVKVMLRALNCMQGARYIELTQANPKNEDFVYGWLLNRVVI